MQQARKLRNRVADDALILGTFIAELSAPGSVQLVANAGLDFVTIDGEHGAYSTEQIRLLIDASCKADIAALVRLPLGDPAMYLRVLDAGASGILVPQVHTMEDVHRAVELSKYTPLGKRGVHFLRPGTNFSPPADWNAFCKEANETLITAVQIETVEAAEIVDQIAATEGVDMLYIGPGDLSMNLGIPGQATHPRILEIMSRVGRSCKDHGKIAARHIGSTEVLGQLAPLGFSVFGYSAAAGLLFDGTVAMVERAHVAVGAK